jgi:hypothetical protein
MEEMEMRLFHTAMLGASVALPVAISGAIIPAHAQSNDVLGQAQRFLNGNQDQSQNAYEQGRQDQMQRDQAQREQWRANHPYAENQYDQGYEQPRYGQYEQPHNNYNNGYGSNNGYGNNYDNGYGNNSGYSR